MLSNPQVCTTLSTLRDDAQSEIRNLSDRLYALRRFASTLELAGGRIKIPTPDEILPLNSIDISALRQLVASCPAIFGDLDLDSASGLNALRAKLAMAYNTLDSLLNDHPYRKLRELDEELNALLDKATAKLKLSMNPALDFLSCLEAVCGAVQEAGNIAESTQAVVAGTPLRVLNEAQETKASAIEVLQAKVKAVKEVGR